MSPLVGKSAHSLMKEWAAQCILSPWVSDILSQEQPGTLHNTIKMNKKTRKPMTQMQRIALSSWTWWDLECHSCEGALSQQPWLTNSLGKICATSTTEPIVRSPTVSKSALDNKPHFQNHDVTLLCINGKCLASTCMSKPEEHVAMSGWRLVMAGCHILKIFDAISDSVVLSPPGGICVRCGKPVSRESLWMLLQQIQPSCPNRFVD
jgi:hypothetical protein